MENATDQIQILYVDDEPGFAETAATFLKREDNRITVETATGAQQGHTYLAAHDVDCIISDYNMPAQNGIEFLEAVREDYPDLPFILYTGKGSEAVASDAISAGVTDYLQKESGSSQYTVLANRITNAVDQYRSKRELQESRNRLSLFVEQSPLGVIEWNNDFKVARANNAAYDILGYTESELVGHSWEHIVPESDRDHVGDVVEQLLGAEGGYLSVNENVTKDGQTVVCEWHNRVVTDDGAVVAIFSQFQDISERREREQRMETLHGTARTLIEADSAEHVAQIVVDVLKDTLDMPLNGVWFHDQDANVLDPAAFTDRAEELIDEHPTFEPGNSLAWEVFETGEVAHYDDVSAVSGRYNTETIMRSEIFVPLGGHGVVTIGSTVADAFDAVDVSLVEIVASHAESVLDRITREQELELKTHRLDAILDNTTTPMFMKSDSGEYLFVNRQYRELFDLADEPIAGQTDHDLHPNKTADVIWEHDQAVLERGEPREFSETITADGEEKHFMVSKVPIYDTGRRADPDSPVAVFAVASDITELRRREQQLQRERDRLDEFASIVSHDLRSPLTVAEGRVTLAQENYDGDELDAVAEAHDRMYALIDNLLTLAREGNQVSQMDPVDLHSLTDRCWHNTQTDAATIRIEAERVIEADRTRLQQLVENLFRNAVEHAGEDVTVTVGEFADGFYVEDNGPGISPEAHDDVFDTDVSTAEGGTGLGLAIVKKVANAHGWQVQVETGDDGGARFEITGVDFVESSG